MLSIIIPAKNEEKNLVKLLRSIKKQNYKDYEVIVADAGSKDKTKKIARKFGCKVIKGGLPSVGRNEGVKHAKGNMLLFLDADVILPDEFIKKLVKEIKERKLDVGSCFSKPHNGRLIDRFIIGSSNFLMDLVKNKWAHSYGWCTFSNKKVHKAIKGYDEDIFLGEDNDYARRASKAGKFGIIKDIKILNSMRRFQEEGRINTIFRYTIHELYRLFVGEIKGHKFEYGFEHKK